MKKILIGAPIGGHKQYSINEWFKWISNQTYPNYDICLCANGEAKDELVSKIKEVEITDIHGQTKKPIALKLNNDKDITIIGKISYSREKIRRYAIKNHYDGVFWLDTDTIPIYYDTLKDFVELNKESISGLYFYKNTKVPVIIDKVTYTNITLEKLEHLIKNNLLSEIDASGYGCVLHTGEALYTAFDYEFFAKFMSDDIGHCQYLKSKGIIRYFSAKHFCYHLGESDHKKDLEKAQNMKIMSI